MISDKIDAIRGDVEAALAEVGKKHNIDFSMGVIRYSQTGFTCTLTAAEASDNKYLAGVNPKIILAGQRDIMITALLGDEINLRGGKAVIVGIHGKKVVFKKPGDLESMYTYQLSDTKVYNDLQAAYNAKTNKVN